jgi:hypothetical protein
MEFYSELLAKSSAEVKLAFEEKQNQLQKTLESFKSMQLPIKELEIASKKQSEAFDYVLEVVELGLKTQNTILVGVQDIQGGINGHYRTHFSLSTK